MDDRSRIDHGRWRDDCGRDNCGLGDHNGIGRNYIMRERNRRRRQADNASRKAESAVVVVMMPPRKYARSGPEFATWM